MQAQPGTVDVPQPTPFTGPVQTSGQPTLPTGVNEVTWFGGQILGMTRNGPAFGPRKDAFLPWLVVRSTPGDNGARPLSSNVWWESPDIYALSDTDPAAAPLIPDFQNDSVLTVEAGKPTTLYAHVWNLGKATASRVRVEFHWTSPASMISQADSHLIGAAWVDLGDRFTRYANWTEMSGPSGAYASRGCHAIVKCPVPWIPLTENGGHECLIVRAFEPILDATPYGSFSPTADRHVAQHNLSVVPAESPAQIDLPLLLGYPESPGDVALDFETLAPKDMPWAEMAGPWAPGLQLTTAPITAGFLPPMPRTARPANLAAVDPASRSQLLRPSETFTTGCDPLQIQFHASVDAMQPNEGAVLRVRQSFNGDVVGGYSIFLYRR